MRSKEKIDFICWLTHHFMLSRKSVYLVTFPYNRDEVLKGLFLVLFKTKLLIIYCMSAHVVNDPPQERHQLSWLLHLLRYRLVYSPFSDRSDSLLSLRSNLIKDNEASRELKVERKSCFLPLRCFQFLVAVLIK